MGPGHSPVLRDTVRLSLCYVENDELIDFESLVVLYLQASILDPIDETITPQSLLEPYLNSLLSLSTNPLIPLFSEFHFLFPPPPTPLDTPPNFLVVPSLASEGTTANLTTALDESVVEGEKLFWKIVGERGVAEGVEFFAKEVIVQDEEDD